MTREELNKALDEIKDGYDAFYFANKYGEGTHDSQFQTLAKYLNGKYVMNALNWIRHQYDCYYKHEYEDEAGTAFGYLRDLIKEWEG